MSFRAAIVKRAGQPGGFLGRPRESTIVGILAGVGGHSLKDRASARPRTTDTEPPSCH
jgi:hypothetical protein